MKHPDYPGVSSFIDNRGAVRWRFRKTGLKTVYLPGEPHTPAFDAAYQAAIEGRVVRKAEVIAMPGAASPHSLYAAWRKLRETARWRKLDPESQSLYTRIIEEFTNQPVGNGRIGDGPVADFRPRHVAAALDAWSATPHKARLLLIVLQKLMKVAIREEWIEYDPTYGADKPDTATEGYKAWPPHLCAQFERHWPIGSRPRTAYELARWLGTRRSDVANIRWDQLVTEIIDGEPVEGFKFVQFKGRNRKGAFPKFHPISPMLAEALAPLPRDTETVLASSTGQPYPHNSLTTMMWHWRKAAGIDGNYSLHGLRKSLGGMLADAGATGHQSRDVLGHDTMSEADRYARSRNQAKTATAGMRAVVRLVRG